MLNCCIRSKMGIGPRVNLTCAKSHSSATPATQGVEQMFVTPNSSFGALGNQPSTLQPKDGEGEVGSSSDEEDKFFEAPEEFILGGQDVTFPRPAVDREKLKDDSTSGNDACSSGAEQLPQADSSVAGDHSSTGCAREGVLHPLKGMLLLATGEQLCVPVTQDPGPLTEDMITEREQVLARLGTSEEATLIRSRIQAGSLLSDMQAFKAGLSCHVHIPPLCASY